MTNAQKLLLSHQILDIATAVDNDMADPNVLPTAQQSNEAQTAVVNLTEMSNAISDSAALSALGEAAANFAKMNQATTDAKAALRRLQGDAQKLAAVLAIASQAVTLGTQLIAVNPLLEGILSAANALSAKSKTA